MFVAPAIPATLRARATGRFIANSVHVAKRDAEDEVQANPASWYIDVSGYAAPDHIPNAAGYPHTARYTNYAPYVARVF